MDKFIIKGNKEGFTLVEIIVVLIIIAILAAIAIPAFTGYIDKSKIAVMEHNQGQVLRTLQLLKIEGNLVWDYDVIKNALNQTGVYVANPFNKSIGIRRSTDQPATFAGIVISQNKSLTMAQQIVSETSKNNNLYPLYAGHTVDRTIFEGTVMVRVAKDGVLVYYYYDGNVNNITTMAATY